MNEMVLFSLEAAPGDELAKGILTTSDGRWTIHGKGSLADIQEILDRGTVRVWVREPISDDS
jgi:hypothetical protein